MLSAGGPTSAQAQRSARGRPASVARPRWRNRTGLSRAHVGLRSSLDARCRSPPAIVLSMSVAEKATATICAGRRCRLTARFSGGTTLTPRRQPGPPVRLLSLGILTLSLGILNLYQLPAGCVGMASISRCARPPAPPQPPSRRPSHQHTHLKPLRPQIGRAPRLQPVQTAARCPLLVQKLGSE